MVDDDLRVERTRAALQTAILQLAHAVPSGNLTIGEIAATAGVGRPTFYRHASSPSGLLVDTLRTQLDRIRDASLRDTEQRRGARDAGRLRETLAEVVDHVRSHESIYRRALVHSLEPAISEMLIGHVTDSVHRYQRARGRSFWPQSAPPLGLSSEAFHLDAAASGFAHLFVGVLKPWLVHSPSGEPKALVEIFTAMAPPWWSAALHSADFPNTRDGEIAAGAVSP